MATPAYNSPYRAFCREQRPLLPTGMKNSDREKALGQMWRELTNAGRATYHRGLKQEPSFGRGGLRVWAPVPLARLPTPTSGAVTVIFLAPGCAPVVSIAASVNGLACDSVSAERTAKTSPPSPDPEDQPAAKRRAYPLVDLAVSPYPENHQRRAYQEAQSLFTHTYLRAASLCGHGSHQAALALLQHARSVPPGCRRAEPPAYPAPHPPLPLAVAQAVLKAEAKAEAEGEAEAEARGQAEAEAIERGGQGEGSHSEGELDRILQEQLARLRSSWSHAS